MLRRLKPALRQSGIDVQLDPDRKEMGSTFPLLRSIKLKKSPVNMVNIVNMFQRKNIRMRT